MLRKLKLNTKLLVSFLVVGLLPFAVISITALMQSKKALEKTSKNQLRSVMEIRKNQISQYFSASQNDLEVLVENVNTLRDQAIQKLETVQELKLHEVDAFFKGVQQVIKKVDGFSEETAKIIKTIDEIAFQTKLLALNAGVEAARAGEAGQGFAVVTDEVRNLAQNAAEAARETGEPIEKSRANSKESVEMVEFVSAVFDDITSKAQKVNELVGEINAAADEQSQGIDQVNIAVGQVDQVTQEVASNAEESAGAAEELNARAKSLLNSVEELKGTIEGQKKITEKSKSGFMHTADGPNESWGKSGMQSNSA